MSRLDTLLHAVRQHADEHYNEGWDVVVETMIDSEIVAAFGSARTEDGAIRKIQRDVVDLWVERQANAGMPEAMRELELGRQDAERDLDEELRPENLDELPNPAGPELPGLTVTGVVCGACTSEAHRPGTTRLQTRHATIAAVRLCAQIRANDEASELEFQAAAEAERSYERYLENGGRHAAAIQADIDEERRREGW